MKKINKEKAKKIIDIIFLVLLCINIFLLNIYVGSTNRMAKTLLETIIIAEGLIYIIISKILGKKQILIKSKIDIAITCLVGTSFLPLLFKTYASLSDTINGCIMYVTIYSLYILTRNLVTTQKRKNLFINVALLASILIVVFGIDKLYFNLFKDFLKSIDSAESSLIGMISTFGYRNAVFAYISFYIFIACGKFLESSKLKLKAIYVAYLQIAMYGFYYGNSRAGIIIFALCLLVFLIKIKEIKKIISIILALLTSYVFVAVFDKLNLINYSPLIFWTVFICTILFNCILNIAIMKIFNIIMCKRSIKLNNENKKINFKIIFAIIAFVVLICTLYVLIAKNYSKPRTFDSGENFLEIYRLKPNTNYTIKVKYSVKTNKHRIKIKLTERNTYRGEYILVEDVLNETSENITKEYNIKTSDIKLDRLRLHFAVPINCEITINNIYINDKEYVFNFKYVPNNLITLFRTISPYNISITERLSMYKSGLKVAGNNILIGNGAKAYKNLYPSVKEYAYATGEVHSNWLDMLMDYGIIGFALFLTIILITIFNYIKERKNKNILNLSIITAYVFTLIHMAVDFDLSYLLTICNFYMFIAILNNSCNTEESNEYSGKKKIINSIFEYITIVFLVIIVIFAGFKAYGEKLYKNKKYEEAIKYIPYSEECLYKNIMKSYSKEDFLSCQKYIMKYLENETNSKGFSILNKLYVNFVCLINKGYIEEGIAGMEEIRNYLSNNEATSKYNVSETLGRLRLMENVLNYIERKIRPLQPENQNIDKIYSDIVNLAKEEYSSKIDEIKDSERNVITKEETEKIVEEYNLIYERIITKGSNL